jgi:hypothetical protein
VVFLLSEFSAEWVILVTFGAEKKLEVMLFNSLSPVITSYLSA